MSLWWVGLGSSVLYLNMKRQSVESTLSTAVKQYQTHEAEPEDSHATMREIRDAWKNVSHLQQDDFNESLPSEDRLAILKAEAELRQEAVDWDASNASPVHGVLLDDWPF